MPTLDGKRAIKEIRALNFDNAIIAVTAATMKGVKQELLALGFNHIVAKPIDKNELYQGLANYLSIENQSSALQNSVQRFLVVEDDEDAADVTVLLLESLGIEAVKAQTAEICQDLLIKENNWTTILLDLHLPDASGLDLAHSIKQSHPNIRLILVSGATVPEPSLKQAGINKAILKPINLEILKGLI